MALPMSLRGSIEVEVTGACPEDFLSRLAEEQIRFRVLAWPDPFTVRLTLPAGVYRQAEICGRKTMCELERTAVRGAVPAIRAMRWRALYLVALGVLTGLVFWLQGRLMFFSVQGNETIPTAEILRALEAEGVSFWTGAEEINMDRLKNRMLSALPSLGWITINREGSFAEVIVRERTEVPAVAGSAAPANILAKKDGIILSVEAHSGDPQVFPETTVHAGDLLISGITFLDRTALLTRAEGEIFARTWTPVRVLLPDNAAGKRYTGRARAGWSLTFGKKTINFYKTSGISYAKYDKITEEFPLTLPGGNTLPLKLTKTTFREYAPSPNLPPQEALLTASADHQLLSTMTAGEIIARNYTVEQAENGLCLTGTAECREEIGQTAEIKD